MKKTGFFLDIDAEFRSWIARYWKMRDPFTIGNTWDF